MAALAAAAILAGSAIYQGVSANQQRIAGERKASELDAKNNELIQTAKDKVTQDERDQLAISNALTARSAAKRRQAAGANGGATLLTGPLGISGEASGLSSVLGGA